MDQRNSTIANRGETTLKKALGFYFLMSFVYHSVIFELLMNRFSPFPSFIVWILTITLSWYVGNGFSSFSRALYLITLSFLTGGIISYFVMTFYLRESIKAAIQIITLKMTVVSLLTIFALSSLVALLGYMFREE